jgi:tetratricopeptide (TPR) repeat protein
MRPKTWIATGLALGLWAGSAQGAAGVLDVTSDVRYKEGNEALDAGKCEQARVAFLQTLSLDPGNPAVLLNLAIAEECTGHYVEALGHLNKYFVNSKADPKTDAAIREEMYKGLLRATGHLRISANPGDDVAVDGVVKGKAPLSDVVHVKPGSCRVTASGQTVHQTVHVTVGAGDTKDVNLASPDNFWTDEHIVGVTTGGFAVVATVVGVGFWIARDGYASDANSFAVDPRACALETSVVCGQYDKARDRAKTAALVSGVSFGAAAVAGVVAGYLLWPKQKEGTRASARVVPTGQGILVEGTF